MVRFLFTYPWIIYEYQGPSPILCLDTKHNTIDKELVFGAHCTCVTFFVLIPIIFMCPRAFNRTVHLRFHCSIRVTAQQVPKLQRFLCRLIFVNVSCSISSRAKFRLIARLNSVSNRRPNPGSNGATSSFNGPVVELLLTTN